MAGSANTQATSRLANAASKPTKSLNSTTLVVSLGSTGAPIFPERDSSFPSSVKVMNVSSTCEN